MRPSGPSYAGYAGYAIFQFYFFIYLEKLYIESRFKTRGPWAMCRLLLPVHLHSSTRWQLPQVSLSAHYRRAESWPI